MFDETDVDESDSEEDNNVVQNSDAINAANMLIKRSEQNTDLTAKHMSNLLQISDRYREETNIETNKTDQTHILLFAIK